MPTYLIDRFRDGKPMAEGAEVRAESNDEALAKARALFDEPSCQHDTFKIISVN